MERERNSAVRAVVAAQGEAAAWYGGSSVRAPQRHIWILLLQNRYSQNQPYDEEGRPCFSVDNMDMLVKGVRATMGVAESKEPRSAQDIMFAGLCQRSRKAFPVVDTVKTLIKREWDKQDKGFLPSSAKRRHPFEDNELAEWMKVPKVDAAVASTSKAGTLPLEDVGLLKDPFDRKADMFLRKVWESTAGAFKPAISSTCTARSVMVWISQLEEQLKSKVPRDKMLNSLSRIREGVAYLADTSVDSLKLAARSAGLSNAARRALWLKTWKGDAQAKAKLCTILCRGEYLFGPVLDDILAMAEDRKKGFPKAFSPTFRNTFRRRFQYRRPYHNRDWEPSDPKKKGSVLAASMSTVGNVNGYHTCQGEHVCSVLRIPSALEVFFFLLYTPYFVLIDLTGIQCDVSEITQKYEDLGVALNNREGQLSTMLEKMKKVQQETNQMLMWLESKEKVITAVNVSPTKSEIVRAQAEQNKGKHRVTKRRAALSNPMFTLVTSVKVKKQPLHTYLPLSVPGALLLCSGCERRAAGKHHGDVTAVLSGRCAHSQSREAERRGQTAEFISELEQSSEKVEKLKAELKDLLEKYPNSPEAETWRQMLEKLNERWDRTKQVTSERQQKLEESANQLATFQAAGSQLLPWLTEKELMMSVLGPLSIDPNMLSAQKQQVQLPFANVGY
ncbi:unnamed protein product [Ranitomeya imitator]|uniref:Lamina-associated polypeptide 2 alpha C-terminal domain-containing protein n=1 Tax=Ranitomeya imitator TaxID=111125 RepID=A0ABN9MK72_9NEOB|nr:unnamed protein product [Ranitomeya imitator]